MHPALQPLPTAAQSATAAADPPWRAQEQLLLQEVMRLIGKSLAPGLVLREMLHLMSELLGLNRGRIVLMDTVDAMEAVAPANTTNNPESRAASIHFAYGLTRAE
ncbi:sigma-54-dependent Fis family transcriptional regulator, partial [Roseateles sp. GG27B]